MTVSDLVWAKSSYSADSANCVEVAHDGDRVLVRDSKHPAWGRQLEFTLAEWAAFTAGVKVGEFDV